MMPPNPWFVCPEIKGLSCWSFPVCNSSAVFKVQSCLSWLVSHGSLFYSHRELKWISLTFQYPIKAHWFVTARQSSLPPHSGYFAAATPLGCVGDLDIKEPGRARLVASCTSEQQLVVARGRTDLGFPGCSCYLYTADRFRILDKLGLSVCHWGKHFLWFNLKT